MRTKNFEDKWFWITKYCKDKGISPFQSWAWEEGEAEYAKHIENEGVLMDESTMLMFKLRLNIDEWGGYKKGDVDTFYIKLLSEDNGLVRFPIDERWDILSCKII